MQDGAGQDVSMEEEQMHSSNEESALNGSFRIIPLTIPADVHGDYEGAINIVSEQIIEYLRPLQVHGKLVVNEM